jgi:GNAT superfamily N-acetyltransferase
MSTPEWRREGARSLVAADAPACVALARETGWPTDERGWRSMIAVGEGFAFDDAQGTVVATVILNRYDPGLAALAMMLVHPARRREGLGRALLEHALARAAGDVVFLFATELGERLYVKHGFAVVAHGARILREQLPAHAAGDARPMRHADLPSVVSLDAVALGASRHALLESLFHDADRSLVVERAGVVVSFGFARLLGGTRVVGPVIAASDGDAIALAAALGSGSTEPVRLDLPPEERTLRAWLTADGRATSRDSPLMVRGGAGLPGQRGLLRAMASLAYG